MKGSGLSNLHRVVEELGSKWEVAGFLQKVKIILEFLLWGELLHERPDGEYLPGDTVEQTLRVSGLRYIIGVIVVVPAGAVLHCLAIHQCPQPGDVASSCLFLMFLARSSLGKEDLAFSCLHSTPGISSSKFRSHPS